MKIKFGDLRKIISDQIERNYRWSAGLAPGGVGKGNSSGRMGMINYDIPGLGPESENAEEEQQEEQEQEELSTPRRP